MLFLILVVVVALTSLLCTFIVIQYKDKSSFVAKYETYIIFIPPSLVGAVLGSYLGSLQRGMFGL